MSGEDVAAAAEKLEAAVYECLQRSENVATQDLHLILNLLSGKLRAKGDKLRENAEGPSDETLIDDDGEVSYG